MVEQIEAVDFVYTDGWHPTVNPSSRMPIYYLRHNKLLQSYPIILNEFPRTKGGSTFRFIRFENNNHATKTYIKSFNTFFQFVPWWLQSSLSETFLFPIYNDVLKNKSEITLSERNCIEKVYSELKENVSPDISIGELLHSINFKHYSTILPTLPNLQYSSFSKSIFKNIFYKTLSSMEVLFFSILKKLCEREKITYLSKVAFCNDPEYNIYRISWVSPENNFYKNKINVKTGEKIGVKEKYSYENFITDLNEGKIVLSSKIVCITEVISTMDGKRIFHFGNTYNNISSALSILSESELSQSKTPFVKTLDDNEDSWNYAYLRFAEDYPIHLFDLLPLNDSEVFKKINHILKISIENKTPLYIPALINLTESIKAFLI